MAKKCKGGECPIKEQCYKFTAANRILQTYFKPPFELTNSMVSTVKCDNFQHNLI